MNLQEAIDRAEARADHYRQAAADRREKGDPVAAADLDLLVSSHLREAEHYRSLTDNEGA